MRHRLSVLPGLAAALVLAISVLAGCQKSQEAITNAAIERASDGKVKVARDGDRVTIKTDEGEVAMQGGDDLPLPKDFPKDIYLPRSYRINSVMDIAGAQVISLQAPGKVADVFGAARDAMDKAGWKQTMAMQNSSDSAMLAYEKGQRAAVMSFNNDGTANKVTMSVQLRSDKSR